MTHSINLLPSSLLVVAKVKEAQYKKKARGKGGGSKQMSVLPECPDAKVCVGLEGIKEGGIGGWCGVVGRGGGGGDGGGDAK